MTAFPYIYCLQATVNAMGSFRKTVPYFFQIRPTLSKLLVLWISLSLGSAGCSLSIKPGATDYPGLSCFTSKVGQGVKLSSGPGAFRAVVFVHGYTGSADSLISWATVLCQDQAKAPDLPRVDIFVFEYPTELLGCPETLMGAASKLQLFLSQPEMKRYVELTVVAHSFGGLVTLRYMLDNLSTTHSPEVNISKILLAAVPLDGADIARWGMYASCQAAAATLESKELTELQAAWKQLGLRATERIRTKRSPPDVLLLVGEHDRVVTLGNTLPTGLDVRVRKLRSVKVAGKSVDADHSTIIRVDSRDHDAHMALRELLATPWNPPTPPGKIGIWIASIAGEGGEHQNTLKVLLEGKRSINPI